MYSPDLLERKHIASVYQKLHAEGVPAGMRVKLGNVGNFPHPLEYLLHSISRHRISFWVEEQ